jgi:hypothetical protein
MGRAPRAPRLRYLTPEASPARRIAEGVGTMVVYRASGGKRYLENQERMEDVVMVTGSSMLARARSCNSSSRFRSARYVREAAFL